MNIFINSKQVKKKMAKYHCPRNKSCFFFYLIINYNEKKKTARKIVIND